MRRAWRRVATVAAVVLAILATAAALAWWQRHELFRLALGLPPYTHAPGEHRELHVPMRDGVPLATQVVLPEGEGPWPTVFLRGPYNLDGAFVRLCEFYARYGYACAHQDVRGRFGSEGEWVPFEHEREDGQDALDWLVSQPWQDGNVALLGPSYLGIVQWAVADALPPEVKTLVPMVSATDLYAAVYDHGLFRHDVFTAWTAVMHGHGMDLRSGEAYREAIRHWPPREVDELYFGGRLPWYRNWISSPGRGDPFWRRPGFAALRRAPERVRVPMLLVGGWYDFFLASQLDDFRRLATRDRSVLLVGPWVHTQVAEGDRLLPDEGGVGLQNRRILEWLGHHLRGEPLREIVPGSLELYSIGEGRWRRFADWPPAGEVRRFHLGELDHSAACDGGALASEPPSAPQSVSWRHDPSSPVPSRGGASLLAFVFEGFDGPAPGPVRQDGLCERADVLSFVSEPLRFDLPIAGAVSVTLTVASDAPDTAFVAKLVQVSRDGTALLVREGISSLAFRDDAARPRAHAPGTPVELRLELAPIAWRVPAGARLRLDVASSSFPAYHAHPNRAEPWADVAEPVTAVQTLRAGPGAPARVDVPVWYPPLADEK